MEDLVNNYNQLQKDNAAANNLQTVNKDDKPVEKTAAQKDQEVGDEVTKRQKEFDKANPKDANESPYNKQLNELDNFHKESLTKVIKNSDAAKNLDAHYSEAHKKLKKQRS